ncbi:hypothetical protein [Streptomyces adelaidensis]|uniref:hypothetical protein n=1 Tax=Streptomyces adelaidensis TaxID=2796465 RepID=UPI001904CB7A|nr:hypothetical protein [Streptomyces adelaidensis]
MEGGLTEGEAVSVTVSTGAPEVDVPDVTDKDEDEDEVSRILKYKGFKTELRHVESEGRRAGPSSSSTTRTAEERSRRAPTRVEWRKVILGGPGGDCSAPTWGTQRARNPRIGLDKQTPGY